MPDRDRATLSLPPAAWLGVIFAAVVLAGMLTLLILQLAVLKDSRQHIQAQDAKISKLVGESGPVLRGAEPLLRQARPLARALRATAVPVLRDLDRSDLAGT